MLGLLNIIHGLAESAPQLGKEYDITGQHNVTHDSDILSHTLSHSVTHNIIYDTDLWNDNYHVTLLSGCDMHLEADAKVLATLLRCLACFIQKCSLKGCSIEQFSSVLGIGSYIWILFQAVSEASWDHFKILPQPDAPTLVEAMRTVYSSIPIPTSSNVEMAVNALEIEEVAFTLVTNQKHKGKGKVPSPLSGTPTNSRSNVMGCLNTNNFYFSDFILIFCFFYFILFLDNEEAHDTEVT